jgi:biotin carboxyl carrier protein
MEHEFYIDGTLHVVSLQKKKQKYLVKVNDSSFEADVFRVSPNILSVLILDRSYRIFSAGHGPELLVSCSGQSFELTEPEMDGDSFLGEAGKSTEDELVIKSPMPGKVIKIHVKENEKVHKNQTLAIVEAMKMENEIKSGIDGIIKRIHASPGDLVDAHAPIFELELES